MNAVATADRAPIHDMDNSQFQGVITSIIRRVFGAERHAAKRLSEAAGVTVETAKNWLKSDVPTTPQGLHLMRLMATVPEMASAIRHLTAMTDADPEFARDFMRAMQTFQRVQEMRNAAMAMDAGGMARGGDAASARPPREPAHGHGDAMDAAPLPVVGTPQ